MSLWATVRRNGRPNEVHVMPCNGDSEILNGHVVTEACWCSPRLSEECDPREGVVFVHNDPERGGYNA